MARTWKTDIAGPALRPIWQMRRPPMPDDPFAAGVPLVFDPLTEPRALAEAVAGVDAVLVLAGPTEATADHEAHAALARAVLTARTRAADAVVPVILMSSAAVYGRALRSLDEDAPCAPETAYGRGKLAMERVAAGAEAVHVLRLGNVVGADALLARAGQGKPTVLDRFDDGATPQRSYIGPVGLARVLEGVLRRAVAGQGLPAVLNIAAGQVEMAALAEAAGFAWIPRAAPAGAIREVRLDTGRLAALISLPAAARTAAGMVAEWRGLVAPAVSGGTGR